MSKRSIRPVARFSDPRVDAQMREVLKQTNAAIDDLINAEEALTGHTADDTNPHKVTAEQTGAATREGLEAHEALNVPLGNTAHGITAAMLGGNGGGGAPLVYYEAWSWPFGTTSARTEKGFGCRFLPMLDCKILGVLVKTDWVAGAVYQIAVKDLGHIVIADAEYTAEASGTGEWREILFAAPVEVTALTEYYCDFWRVDGVSPPKYFDAVMATAFVLGTKFYSGTSDSQNSSSNPYALIMKIQAG